MRFLSISTLKQELRNDSLSENEAFPYFFAVLIFETLLINSSFALPGEAEFTLLDVLSVLVPTFIAGIGTWFFYVANGGKGGRHFFLRYFSILWVVGLRFLLFSSILFVVWLRYFFPDGDFAYEWEAFAVSNVLYAIFYWRVWVHISGIQSGAINRATTNHPNQV